MAAPSRGRVRDVYLRLLGVIFLAAFLSLLAQVRLLLGRDGLLPAATYVDAIRHVGFFAAPTIFWFDARPYARRRRRRRRDPELRPHPERRAALVPRRALGALRLVRERR